MSFLMATTVTFRQLVMINNYLNNNHVRAQMFFTAAASAVVVMLKLRLQACVNELKA